MAEFFESLYDTELYDDSDLYFDSFAPSSETINTYDDLNSYFSAYDQYNISVNDTGNWKSFSEQWVVTVFWNLKHFKNNSVWQSGLKKVWKSTICCFSIIAYTNYSKYCNQWGSQKFSKGGPSLSSWICILKQRFQVQHKTTLAES